MAQQRDRFVIVGGGPTGLSAARGYREAGGDAEVRMISADSAPPYFRPPLSKEFLRGEAGEADLPLADNDFYREHDIGLTLEDPVTALDAEARTVTTRSGHVLSYTQCLLATGAEPVRPPVPGAEHPGVRTLRSVESARQLRAAAEGARSAVVTGAGFIGCEAAVSLARLGLSVTLICREQVPQAARLGTEAGRFLLRWLESECVTVLTGTSLDGVEDGHRVHTDQKSTMDTDLVLLATGIRPRAGLAEKAGLTLSQGRVPTDEHHRTAAPGLLAAGDVALTHNPTAGRPLPVEHWGEAETMGAIAGRTAAGADASWDVVPGFWSVIGDRVLKYAAWGDGFDQTEVVEHGEGAFTVWYGLEGTLVGVLTHEADEDYERGGELVARKAAFRP